MPPQFRQMWNPLQVAMKQGTSPYVGGSVGTHARQIGGQPGPMPGPAQNRPPGMFSGLPAQNAVPAPGPAQGTVGPESVRATGQGPFDPAYRQNLATYAGGPFARPGGNLSFNPTDLSTFPGLPTGGGTAPVSGMPLSLLDMALGGQPFSWAPPTARTGQTPPNFAQLQDWLDQFMKGGRGLRQQLA